MEVTVRTMQGRFLLRPSPAMNEAIVGALGRAQRLYGMTLHACVFLSNHFHLLVSPESPQQLARFMNHFNSRLAREACRLHSWKDHVWDRRYQAIAVSDEEAAQVARLSYLLSHGPKEGLVARPQAWPGVHCARALVEGFGLEGRWINRTARYTDSRRKNPVDQSTAENRETVIFSQLPCWAELSPSHYRLRIQELISSIERTLQPKPESSSNLLGAENVVSQHPHTQCPQRDRRPAPLIHAATRRARLAFHRLFVQFVTAFRQAASRLRAGDRSVEFPRWSFPPPLPSP